MTVPIAGDARPSGPLAGLRILDISTIIAGPFAATVLADLGAEVLKVELPGRGDGLRALPPHKDGSSLWWKVTNRNKRGITLDLRKPAGRALFERLLPRHDVLVENFRPGTLDEWDLPLARLHEVHRRLHVLRVTGFGQTGPYRDRPGFARIFEALSGFTHICGEADGPPMHLGFPISDSIGGLFGALGILAAVRHGERHPDSPGQEIDLSMTEAMFRTLDFLAIEFDQLGVARSRMGNLNPYAAPGNVYRTRDGQWVTIAISAPTIFPRLAQALGRPELATDPRFATNLARIRHRDLIEPIVGDWIAARDLDDVVGTLERHDVSVAPIRTIDQIFADPQMQAREAIVSVPDPEFGTVRMQNVVPRFPDVPGAVRRSGPVMGEHNDTVFRDELGLSADDVAALQRDGVI